MTNEELIALVDKYIDLFTKRRTEEAADTYAVKAIDILTGYKNFLSNKESFLPPAWKLYNSSQTAKFYTSVGYHSGVLNDYHDAIHLEGADAPSASLMVKFLKELPIKEVTEKIDKWSWKRYEDEALFPAMQQYLTKRQQKQDYQKLLTLVNLYLPVFEKRVQDEPKDTYAPVAINILKVYQALLMGGSPYAFHSALNHNYHTALNVWGDSLPSCTLMRQFIEAILATKLANNDSVRWASYSDNVLEPGIAGYQLKLKDQNLILGMDFKHTLKAAFDTFELSLLPLLNERMNKFVLKVLSDKPNDWEKFANQGLTLELLFNFRQVKGPVAQENAELISIINFMYQYKTVLSKEKATVVDYRNLQSSMKTFEDTLLKQPEVRGVSQYHWLINLVCNLINDYITEYFKSDNKVKANGFFTQLNNLHTQAVEQIEWVDGIDVSEPYYNPLGQTLGS